MSEKRINPPKWMDRLLAIYCKESLLEDLQGDLHEYYHRNLPYGRFKANVIYLFDVLKFFRLYTIKKPSYLNQSIMLTLLINYTKTSFRNLKRSVLFSSINIFGLSIAMSIGFLMITYIGNLLSFDNFHDKGDHIYKVQTNYVDYVYSEGSVMQLASSSYFLADKLQTEATGIEKVAVVRYSGAADVRYEEKQVPLEGLYASNDFLDLFSFELLSGDRASCLKEPYSLVLTEKGAKKLFKDTDVVGKTVTVKDQSYLITGVMKDPPKNTHFGDFERLESFSSLRPKGKLSEEWKTVWSYHTYILLHKEANPSTVTEYLNNLAEVENTDLSKYEIQPYLQPLDQITPGAENNRLGPYVEWSDLNKLIALTLIIVACAIFNFTNLSLAQSLRRAKEVGVRKINGASQGHVFAQFILEAFLTTAIAVLFAAALYFAIKPEFITHIIGEEQIPMSVQVNFLPYILLFVLALSILAGILPSYFLSRITSKSAFSSVQKVQSLRGISFRKILIVLQFSVSMGLIVAASIMYRQYQFAIDYDLGFRSENILNIRAETEQIPLLKSAFRGVSNVQKLSTSTMIPGIQMMYLTEIAYEQDTIQAFYNKIDEAYLDVHEIELSMGSNFPRKPTADSTAYAIVDQLLLDEFGIDDPYEALGKQLYDNEEDFKYEICGVLKNYQYTELQSSTGPTILIQSVAEDQEYVNLQIGEGDVLEMLSQLEETWKTVDPLHPFIANFYDAQIQEAYSEYKSMFRIFMFLAAVAVCISSLGFLAIVILTTESKVKELSIRKVLGATNKNLVYLLSRNFLIMLVIAGSVAIPIVYYLFDEYVLPNFRDQIVMGPLELLSGFLIMTTITFLLLRWQALKAARTNPAEMLRDE
ncbi:MAG: ABC transporter permease [Bacteroidota bacterium]